MVRYGIATVLTFVMGYLMGYRPGGGFLGVVGAGLLVIGCSFAISWIFALMGVLMSKASAVQGVSMLILFPLTFMSSAFVPVETMPGWMQAFVNVNPVSHLVNAARDLANDGTSAATSCGRSSAPLAIIAIFAPLTVRMYMRKA